MCDFSAKAAKQRAAAKDDRLISGKISAHTRGFVGVAERDTAVCLLPGTELSFDKNVEVVRRGVFGAIIGNKKLPYTVARFCQIDITDMTTHHDALEFVDGTTVKLDDLVVGQTATVIQLPVDPKTLRGQARQLAHAKQKRAEYI